MGTSWREVGVGVYTRPHVVARVNIGLVVGGERALVVDTGATVAAGEEILAAVRELTGLPLLVANTHAHFDHFFGNAAFEPRPIWGHVECVAVARRYGAVQRALMAARAPEPLATQLRTTPIVVPDESYVDVRALDLGGREIHLRHLGRGHTNNDTVVAVPDAGVLFAGDLVEDGPSPGFSDSFPLDWPATLDRLAALVRELPVVVPGHGGTLAAGDVATQAALVAEVARLAREALAAGETVGALAARLPLPGWAAGDAAARALRQLTGGPDYDPPADILATIAPG